MRTIEGKILEQVKSGIILQQVNAQGVMGSGFAKAIRELYPKVWDCYSQFVKPHQADQGASQMGNLIMTRVLYGENPDERGFAADDLWIGNMVGQQFYGRDGRQYTSYEALDDALSRVAACNEAQFVSPLPIHFPMIGAGFGGGHWPTIKALIEKHLGEFDLTLWLQPGEVEPQ